MPNSIANAMPPAAIPVPAADFMFATLPVQYGQKYPPLVQPGTYRPETTQYGQVIPQSAPGTPQLAYVCSPTTGLAVIDVDHPGREWEKLSEVKAWLDDHDAQPYTIRRDPDGDHVHYYLDCRAITMPPACSPRWGDVKSNGYVIAPGGLHPSGVPYERGPGGIVQADARLAEAIAEDMRWAAEMTGDGTGTGTPGGVEVYWQQGIAAASIGRRNDLLHAVAEMFERGLPDDEIRRELDRVAVALDPARPWTPRWLDRSTGGSK